MMRHPRLVLVFAALVAATACGERAVEQIETSAAVPVRVEAASTGPLEHTIRVTGVVAAAPGGELLVTAPAPGRIAELPKAEGDAVTRGDLLVRFDIPSLAADLAARRAEADQARARAATARAASTRLAGLLDRGIAAAREVEEAQRDAADADAAVAQSIAAVSAAETLAGRAEVRATFDGVIAKRWHNPGDLVDASASDPILRVVNPHSVQVVAGVPLGELTHIAIGGAARITGPGEQPDAAEAARVISRPAAVDPGQALADVRLAFVSPTRLPVGASVTAVIVLDRVDRALIVPRTALVDEDGKMFVFVVGADKIAHKHAVTLGVSSEDHVQVTSGLQGSDQVVVRGQNELPDGATVTIAP